MYKVLLTVDGKPLKFITLPMVPRQHDTVKVDGVHYIVWFAELEDGDEYIIIDSSKININKDRKID